MGKLRFYTALYLAKTAQGLLRAVRKNGGTNVPGTVALKICPDFIGYVAKPRRIIGITGTDGKTTVANLVIDSLEKNGCAVLSNRNGSNVDTGISSALLSGVTWGNRPKFDTAVLEIDERSSIRIYRHIRPDYIICTDLFRDSMRRNAHPEYIRGIIEGALPESSELILNADDIISGSLGRGNRRVYFGVDRMPGDPEKPANIINDVQVCPNCRSMLKYNFARYHHIGNVVCPNCGFHSPEADYAVQSVDRGAGTLVLRHAGKTTEYRMISDSIFNIYNEAAVIALLCEMGFSSETVGKTMQEVQILGSRFRQETVKGVTLMQITAKGQNAVACSCVFDYIRRAPGDKEIVLILDDFFDAKKSSENLAWIYDCDFEFLNDASVGKIVITGKRAQDYFLRLLLAGVPREKLSMVRNEPDAKDSLDLSAGKTVYLLYDVYNTGIAAAVRENIVHALAEGDQK